MFSQIMLFKNLMTHFTASSSQPGVKKKEAVFALGKSDLNEFSEVEVELENRLKEVVARKKGNQDPFFDVLSANENRFIYLLSHCLIFIYSNQSSAVSPLNQEDAERKEALTKVVDEVKKLFAELVTCNGGFINNLIKIQISIINHTKHPLLVKAAPFAKLILDAEKERLEANKSPALGFQTSVQKEKEASLTLFEQSISEEMKNLNIVDPITASTIKSKLNQLAESLQELGSNGFNLNAPGMRESKSFLGAFCKPTSDAVDELSTSLWLLYSSTEFFFSMTDEDTSLASVKKLFAFMAATDSSFRNNLLTIKDSVFQKDKALLMKSTAPFALEILSDAGKLLMNSEVKVQLAALAAAVKELGANLFLDLNYPEIKKSKLFLESLCQPTKSAIDSLCVCLVSTEEGSSKEESKEEPISFLKELFIEKAIMDPRFKNNLISIKNIGLREGTTDLLLIRGAVLVCDILEEVEKPKVEVDSTTSLSLRA